MSQHFKVKKSFILEDLIFKASENNNNFKIFTAIDQETKKKEKVKGALEEFEKGKEIFGYFTPVKDPKYGDQYQINSILDYTPDENEIEKIVANLLGKVPSRDLFRKEEVSLSTYKKIVSGDYPINSLSGIGEKTLSKIDKRITQDLDVIILSSLLSDKGVTKNLAAKILGYNSSISRCKYIVENEPHKLMDIQGVGFAKADNIASYADEKIPIEERMDRCCDFLLKKNEENGSTYMKLSLLKKQIIELLKKEDLNFETLYGREDLVITKTIIGNRKSLNVEATIASFLSQKMKENHASPKSPEEVKDFLRKYQDEKEFYFTDVQSKFFEIFIKNNVVCLLGYAGTGKSAIQKATAELCKYLGWGISQAAPTGRAAQVMKGYTGLDSSTLHSMFKINQPKDNGAIFLPGDISIKKDVLLIDEGSMIDIFVGEYLVSGILSVKRLVIVGDPEQLPSVGAGRFLQDLIDGGVPYVELKDVFRQSEGGILDMATKARKGKNIVPTNSSKAVKIGKDAIFHETDKDNIENAIIHYIKLLNKKVPLEDITVITPKNIGSTGTEKLNRVIQGIFNPRSSTKLEIELNGTVFRVGDTVMCNKNSNFFQGQINNGELGTVRDIGDKLIPGKFNEYKTLCLTVDFSGSTKYWPVSLLEALSLGYATTIHKMQGSSNKAIIMIADKSSTYMLNRQLVYTGLTRPRKRLILLGDAQTINMAVKKDGSAKRNTMLATYLNQLVHNKEDTN